MTNISVTPLSTQITSSLATIGSRKDIRDDSDVRLVMTKWTISSSPDFRPKSAAARHARSYYTGCDATSYPYAKGKLSALKAMLAGDFSDLDDVLGEEGVTQADLMKVAITFFIAMYGLPRGTSIESARFVVFAKKTRKTQKPWLCPQHLLICYSTCCGPICRRCCGKRQMSMDDSMNQTTSPTSGGSSAMAFLFL